MLYDFIFILTFGILNAFIRLIPDRKEEWGMLTTKRILVVGLTEVLMALVATPAFSESISLKNAGVGVWTFILTGVVIVLMQFIPAAMLFFSFLVTTSLIVFKQKKLMERMVAEREKVLLPRYEPTVIREMGKIGKG